MVARGTFVLFRPIRTPRASALFPQLRIPHTYLSLVFIACLYELNRDFGRSVAWYTVFAFNK